MKLDLKPPSGRLLTANGGVIRQELRLHNSMHGSKPLLLRMRMEWRQGEERFVEMLNITDLPDAL